MAGVLWRDDEVVRDISVVQVDLGDRSYPIKFQELATLGSTLAGVYTPGKCVLVSNTVVGPLYKQQALDSLTNAGWQASYVEIIDGEENKTVATYLGLVEELLNLQVDRKTPVIGMGGGVTTDIVGFAAATTLRGLPFMTIPTSLLAMVDASVGGKTGVNTSHGKNLLGCFWQPILVLVPVETLVTLPDAELRCGMGEVVKHAVLEEVKGKPSEKFFQWLEKGNGVLMMQRDSKALAYAIRRCCEIKASVVAADETEQGKRALLNLGHTVGHAIEQVLGFGGIRHGEAVAIGTVAEAQLGVLRNACSKQLPPRITSLLEAIGLPTMYPGLSTEALLAALLMDKKREGQQITVTIPYAIGDVRLEKLVPEDLRACFESLHLDGSPIPSKEVAGDEKDKRDEIPKSCEQEAPSAPSPSRSSTRVAQPPGGRSSVTFG